MTQFSLFGAAMAEPSLDDLDGVLLAGGHWVRAGGAARLSVVVVDRWRADALASEFAARGLGDAGAVVAAAAGHAARTAFRAELLPQAESWTRGATEEPPSQFTLSPGGLRLWTIAGGRPDAAGYLLATAAPDSAVHRAAGAQLARLGLAAVSITARAGPGWRVASVRRMRRLVELLGDPPQGAGGDWPQVP